MSSGAAAAATCAAKQQLRKSVKARLAQLPAAVVRTESAAIARRLWDTVPEYRGARRVAIFLSMPVGEVDTTSIAEDLLMRGDGAACYVPRCSRDRMQMLRVRSVEDLRALPLNAWKIPEPASDDTSREVALMSPESALDVILVPGVCFDRDGRRMGHGKGYYDRFIAECEAFALRHDQPMPRLVALALNAQILGNVDMNENCDGNGHVEVPTEPHDRRMDVIVTPTETMVLRPCSTAVRDTSIE